MLKIFKVFKVNEKKLVVPKSINSVKIKYVCVHKNFRFLTMVKIRDGLSYFCFIFGVATANDKNTIITAKIFWSNSEKKSA